MERGDDDLIDLPAAERIEHGYHRIAIADLAVGLGAHLAQPRDDLVEP
jgi:hypothetical protein